MLLSKDDYFPTLAITAMLSHLTCYLQFKEGKCSNCQVDAKGKRSDGTKPLYPQCAVAMSSFTHEPDDRIFRQCTCCAFHGLECNFDSMDESSSLRDMEPSSSGGSTKPAQKASNRHLKETKQEVSPMLVLSRKNNNSTNRTCLLAMQKDETLGHSHRHLRASVTTIQRSKSLFWITTILS